MNGQGSTVDASSQNNGSNRLPYGASRIFAESPDDEICVTGLAGRFPNCHHVGEFEHNLYNKIDMVAEHGRWPEWPELPKRMGFIPNVDRFDAQFFAVHHRQANTTDPQGRLLLESAYEAITDAGINPKSLRGSRTGVFVGACFAESERTVFYDMMPERGFGLTGCCRSMMPNRISYSLGLQGPSLLLDTACSSSMYALDAAFSAIRSGQCDAAIVSGANLILHAEVFVQFVRMGVLAQDAYSRPFDKDASGYVRAEAITTLFLQKAKDAKRIYAKVLYSKTNCDGYKEHGMTSPSGAVQQRLLAEFYSDLQLDPCTVGYVEAHSTGTVVGDPEECRALDNVFCQGRAEPLLVGSVKSNMGHSESASAGCSIAKVILALERAEVAPNLHFTANRPDIEGLVENRMQVCTKRTPLPDNALIGINSFGLGGANAHTLLQGHTIRVKQNDGAPADDIPRLVNWSGRTAESVPVVIDYLQSNPLDAELIGLLHNIQNVEESGFIHRGYGVFSKAQDSKSPAICLSSGSQRYEGVRRPLVWIFSGMGSQWPQMGLSLMSIPLFAHSILESQEILKPFGIDLLHILTDPDKSVLLENTLNTFLGIATVQIGIVDILKVLGLQPDYIIGHSMGELACGYADGSLTRKQMILLTYYRGVACQSVKMIRGSMVAVGLGYRQIVGMLPAGLEVACHNSFESSTISGPEDSVNAFVAELTSKGIFNRIVNSSHMAYHSQYVSGVADKLLEMTRHLFSGERRSDKWLSTSVPMSAWNEPDNQISSPKYFVNNMLKSVLFEETSALLPANAVTIEIAPHGLLQAIVKRSMPDAVHIPMTHRGHANNAAFFLSALGRLYINGFTMPIDKLYPPVAFPVSRGTPKISPLIRWNHDEKYYVSAIDSSNGLSSERRIKVNVSADEFTYINGHTIDDRCLFPATGYLELVWMTFARMKGKQQHTMNVEFEDVQYLRATALQPETDVELSVDIHHGNGSFEVSEGSTSIVTGFVREMENTTRIELPPLENHDHLMLDQQDFYKELRLCGYHYKDAFASVVQARTDGSYGRVRWNGNWVSFMDCALQIMTLSKDTRSLTLPTRIQSVRIFGREHLNIANEHQQDVEVFYNDELNVLQAGGIEIVGFVATEVARRKAPGHVVLESYKFIEHFPIETIGIEDILRICIQLVFENHPRVLDLKVVEIQTATTRTNPLVGYLTEVLEQVPKVTANLTLLTDQTVELANVSVLNAYVHQITGCHLIIASDSLTNAKLLGTYEQSLVNDGFLLAREQLNTKPTAQTNFNVISTISTGSYNIWLLKRKPTAAKSYKVIDISDKTENFDWLEEAKLSVKNKSLLLVAQHDRRSGIVGLKNCLTKEPETKDVCCFLIDDERAPEFDVKHPVYAKQLALNLAVNVYRDGAWGSYRTRILSQDKTTRPFTDHLFANVLRNGDLSSFSWIQGPLKPSNNDGLVRVQYSSINFKDVMLATGRLSSDINQQSRLDKECVLGLEYSGTTYQQKNVMGLVASGSMGTLIKPYAPLTWNVPAEWSLEQAATVPMVYLTVYYAFFTCKAITAGKTILIHAGSGGVGLAAIRVALAYGLKVFTTVSTQEKKNYILDMFPRLKECNIGNSRDCSFERMIMLQTHGKGVDYVLNSLSDEKLLASVRCLGRAGTFLEIGKFDLSSNTKIGLGVFLKEMAFRSVLVDNLFLQSSEDVHHIHGLIERDLETGIIQPLDSKLFRANEIEQAYRYMSTGQHMGKVLIQVCPEDGDEHQAVPIQALSRVYFDPASVYIISGGLGGLGLELADWMVLRGARKLVLTSKRGVSSKYQSFRIRLWETYGCQVIINTADITTLDGCQTLIVDAETHGTIDGIFHLAGYLSDSFFENQTARSFMDVWSPKVEATSHMDAITRQRDIALSYFVVFSSIAAGRGNAGQTNYGLANSAMERIVERRVGDGLSGKAIEWGAVSDVGMVAELRSATNNTGTLPQRVSSVLSVLDTLLTTPDPIVVSMVVAQKSNQSSSTKKMSLVETVLNIMCIRNLNSISMSTTLNELGLDSLMTIEIKQALEREFEVHMSSQELRNITFLTLQELSENGASRATSVQKEPTDLGVADPLFDMRGLLAGVRNDQEEPVYRLSNNLSTDANVKDHILIVPGAEGDNCPVWRTIAKQLNVPTYISKFDVIDEHTIPEMANTIALNYLQTVRDSNHFTIVGYSYGTLLAIEIARLLEAHGMTGRILCLDGSPAFLKKITLTSIGASTFSETHFERSLVSAIAKEYLPRSMAEQLSEKVHELPLTEKLSALCSALSAANADFDQAYLCSFAHGLRRRTVAAMDYETIHKIRADITLVRATDSAVADIDESFDLARHTTGAVSLKYVEGNHQTILESETLVEIVNAMMQK